METSITMTKTAQLRIRTEENQIAQKLMNVVPVGPKSTNLTCPSCGASVATRLEHKATTKTHVIAVLLCLFLCWPCVCVPYCMDSCRNADHYCPSCNSYLGTYKG